MSKKGENEVLIQVNNFKIYQIENSNKFFHEMDDGFLQLLH